MPTEKAGSFSIWGLGGISTDVVTPIFDDGEFIYEDFTTKMGVIGLSHIFYFNPNTYLETKLNFSGSQNQFDEDSLQLQVYSREKFLNTALRGSLALNKKINAQHTIKVGTIFSRLGYDLFSEFWLRGNRRFLTELDEKGSSHYLRSYAQWNFRPTEKLTLTSGLHYSWFLLNDNQAIEPRLGLKYQLNDRQSISAGFGVHSRLETISLYLAQDEIGKDVFAQPNRDLDFTKARHYVVGYENQLKPDLRLKAEVYYQDLYDVPVRPTGVTFPWQKVFSSLNQNDGFISDTLVNQGTGENYGVELTLEKFFTNNYYFMVTGSIFESKYTGADGIKRNTRYNGNFISNIIFRQGV